LEASRQEPEARIFAGFSLCGLKDHSFKQVVQSSAETPRYSLSILMILVSGKVRVSAERILQTGCQRSIDRFEQLEKNYTDPISFLE
jgi:hypothetical protein